MAAPSAAPADGTIALRAVRGFHVGGERVELRGLPVTEAAAMPGGPVRRSDPNGHYQVGQAYVQHFQLAAPKGRLPILLWHGGGLTGACWEDTPDGRPGWHDFLMRRGWDTCLSDATERGRASWARYPEINPGPPEHRPIDQAWSGFRFGPEGGYDPDPARCVAFPGQRFPIEAVERFEKQFVARWTTSDAMVQRAYDALVRQICPGIILAHSQGGQFAQRAALNAPDKVKALVLIEPSGSPDPATAPAAALRDVPILVVFADFYDRSPIWRVYRGHVERWLGAVREAGGRVDVIDLPKLGIGGNSHMPMMDRNSDEIAAMVHDWLVARGFQR